MVLEDFVGKPICPNQNTITMSDVDQYPLETRSDELIGRLIKMGYLAPARRHDTAAIAEAIARLKQALRAGNDDAGPASAT
jgi:hypothetical protein